MSKTAEIIPNIKKDNILSLLKKNERLDGRKLDEFREIGVETGVVGKAEGSSIVRLGDTVVIAGVKTEIGEPFPDTPSMGVQIVNEELIPLASPIFEPGPPGETSIEISRIVDRGIRSSKMIDLEKLCLIKGKKVWLVFVDIYALNHAGNLIDASALAAISALMTTKIKSTRIKGEELTILKRSKRLPIKNMPILVTVVKIGDSFLLDPSYDEELVSDGRITFAIDEGGMITGIQKGEAGMFTFEEVLSARDIAMEGSKKLRKALSSILQS